MGEGGASIGKRSQMEGYAESCGEGACPRWVAKRPPVFFRVHHMHRICDGFAAERGQAPSPQWIANIDPPRCDA
ncbi:hypothetical protein C1X98_16470 [Pseudomonas sp. FW306-2-11BA]|uniref:Uncharacterized protein n=1 Tax=Pseudomonas fluorescens TaxID=294 RepID=A0A0N9WML1_PSEFL|nr:hypothetical protein AO353_21650 [Pseudomonas fluorescens]PMZ01462.1 hypothetical protein C1Y07_24910 [Pseudomonas sp. FW306-02-F02-AB]PMZ20796.1 hypothetical protein C1Y09_17625 [Pseudomonas sp. FW306-02-F08-AA]PMZ31436.1 hypothetical protein C1X99_26320 [Pseudomonas sp. FW306-02-H06B]PMZ39302.1 hypothetical protein C1Y00_16875 [Pseudomonas sp. FW306-2-11AB]PMZ46266.1 hypothetical protein C1Y03_13375 [Pseudomonas sp. FW306-02-H05-AA]PMZ51560.1 hypothetical protein C1Y04_17810 [Pseudomonas